ncbi:MAG: Asp-tRNA(Asn)/Glu-tRNA(Gln) amidotransferase subunit GatB [Clostridia bacterium]|nr:Asp-tRNA(Asn)/Glu-tRNA(Gln) amidotransferase subunit GatB [Clostridia bacterium]
MKDYEIVVGLEVHAELNTDTKIYCSCKNSFGGEVNTQCCPVCTGMPGALPVLNQKVVEYAIRMGHATGCKIHTLLKQDRKNYYYPDLPKAYQISQFDIPLCYEGAVEFMMNGETKRVGITRIHIEEDAGKLLHQEGIPYTLVDLNRCGVPLIEIVSEPDLRSAEEAKEYLETIRTILLYIGVSDCKMQEGSIRCDVNVSVRPKGAAEFGTRCEMKNINTFSGAERAIKYEAARQIEILEAGGVITQETRRWDDEKGVNVLLRSKEDAQDYRYFPEPDIPPVSLEESWIEELKGEIPEMPNEKIKRYVLEHKLPEADAGIIARDYERAIYFDECIVIDAKLAKNSANWILGDISKYLNESGDQINVFPVRPARLMALLGLVDKGTISGAAAKKVLSIMIEDASEPMVIVEREGLLQNSNEDEMEGIVDAVLAANPAAVEEYRNGRTNVVGFLVGQCMKQSKGKGNPKIINQLLMKKLK